MTLSNTATSQVGGEGVYNFLNLTITPRTAALGGKLVALDEEDPGIPLTNPSHLSADLHNTISLSYVGYFDEIRYGFVSYARNYEGFGTFGIGMQHVGYGSFIDADEMGLIHGTFTSYDMALALSYARPLDSVFSLGVSLKPIFSQMERYSSVGISMDLGVTYRSPEGLFSAGLAARNIGTMIKPYNPNTWERLPFEVVAGISQKLRHAPFRFILTLHQLQTLSLYYQREEEQNIFLGDQQDTNRSFLERAGSEIMSHVIAGVEFVPVRNFYFRIGYNYQRRHELKILERTSAVGFSWGIGLRINRFNIAYSRATYHLVGGSNHFSISTSIQDFVSRNNM